MAYATINKPSEHFHTQLYTGNGSTNSITNDANAGDFQPDWLWIKSRSSGSHGHRLYDSSRGTTVDLRSHGTNGDTVEANALSSFDSDGFSIGSAVDINTSGDNYVAWQWKANGGTTSSNTDGSITSTVQANTTAGFSIVTYTGAGSNATVGHGLGVAPKMVIVKDRSVTKNWGVWHEGLSGGDKYLKLNTTDATTTATDIWNNTVPTSSVFSIGGASTTNSSGDNYVAYCFAEIEGYSKFGSYTGNGSSDGTFVYTGFRPAWIMIKRTDSSGNDWIVIDTKRFTFNQISYYLRANTSDAETDQFNIDEDIVSNGFKLRGDSGNINASGSTYIYMAFAENPLVGTNGIPATAR